MKAAALSTRDSTAALRRTAHAENSISEGLPDWVRQFDSPRMDHRRETRRWHDLRRHWLQAVQAFKDKKWQVCYDYASEAIRLNPRKTVLFEEPQPISCRHWISHLMLFLWSCHRQWRQLLELLFLSTLTIFSNHLPMRLSFMRFLARACTVPLKCKTPARPYHAFAARLSRNSALREV